MDFNRNAQSPAAAPSTQSAAAGASGGGKKSRQDSKWSRVSVVAAVAAVTILLVAAVALVGFGNDTNDEGQYVDSTKLQAVFLNTGQVYFGNIKTLNNRYLELRNIYYLQTASSGQNNNTSVSLVKLGCELHEPYDKMIINRTQVTFWENLQDGGQVAKAVSTFEKQNPNGQKCADQSSSASTNSVNNTQNAGSSSSGTKATNP